MLLLSCWVYTHTQKRYARWQFLVTALPLLAQPSSHTQSAQWRCQAAGDPAARAGVAVRPRRRRLTMRQSRRSWWGARASGGATRRSTAGRGPTRRPRPTCALRTRNPWAAHLRLEAERWKAATQPALASLRTTTQLQRRRVTMASKKRILSIDRRHCFSGHSGSSAGGILVESGILTQNSQNSAV